VYYVHQQLAKQTVALLRVAHMLRLQPLLDVLHHFLLLNAGMPVDNDNGVLSGVMGLVFDAVLEAALGSSSLSKEAYHQCDVTAMQPHFWKDWLQQVAEACWAQDL
jgi:hypothetical protein